MARTPVNVLVLPYRRRAEGPAEYAIFLRADGSEPCWQGVAGGAEDVETPLEAARRELNEETGLSPAIDRWIALDTRGSVPASAFADWRQWGPETFVVHEHTFGVDVSDGHDVALSDEHGEFRWLAFGAASALLRYDSNRTALWELNERLARRARA